MGLGHFQFDSLLVIEMDIFISQLPNHGSIGNFHSVKTLALECSKKLPPHRIVVEWTSKAGIEGEQLYT